MLANIPDKHIPACAVIAILGLRIGEAPAIKWNRVDLDKRMLTVDQVSSRGVQYYCGTRQSPDAISKGNPREKIALLLR